MDIVSHGIQIIKTYRIIDFYKHLLIIETATSLSWVFMKLLLEYYMFKRLILWVSYILEGIYRYEVLQTNFWPVWYQIQSIK